MIFSSARLSAQRSGVLGLLAVYLSSILTFNCSTQHIHRWFSFHAFFVSKSLELLGGDRALPNARKFLHSTRFTHDSMFDGPPKALSELLLRFFYFRAQRREKRERSRIPVESMLLPTFSFFFYHFSPFLSGDPLFFRLLLRLCVHTAEESRVGCFIQITHTPYIP